MKSLEISVWNLLSTGMSHLFSSLKYLLLLSQVQFSTEKQEFANIIEFNEYLESFFARENTISEQKWNESLPTKKEMLEMKKLVSFIYNQKDFSEVKSSIINYFPSLRKYINITVLEDCCVIHEQIPTKHEIFPRYWGYIAIGNPERVQRRIHHSAAHFESDGCVSSQAAHLFHSTRSRTLVVAGASRYAVRGDSRSECQPSFRSADSAHNCRTMFHVLNMIVHDLEKGQEQEENVRNGHFFVQWHGMAETSCLSADVFISAGVGKSAIYQEDIPAKRLNSFFNQHSVSSGMHSATPENDVTCKLTGSSNIFGRYVNRVAAADVCTETAEIEDITGRFVHIEQKAKGRSAFELWTTVIQQAFPIENQF